MTRGRNVAVHKVKRVSRSASLKSRSAVKRIHPSTKASPSAIRIQRTETVHHAHVVPQSLRTIGTPMHPYIRTMFLSLAVGTAGVFASMLYYIHIAHATESVLYGNAGSRITAEVAIASVDGSFVGLIKDLEVQRKDAGGALPMMPREYLRLRAQQEQVSYLLLNRIAYCESKWRMIENTKSTASGYFQILDGTERLTPQYKAGLRKTDPYVNIDMAIALYQKYGTIPWTESQSCWSDSN